MTLSGWTWVDWMLYALTWLVVLESRAVAQDLITRWLREREEAAERDPLVVKWRQLRRQVGYVDLRDRGRPEVFSSVPTEKALRDISPGRVLAIPDKELKNVRRRPKRPGHRNTRRGLTWPS